MDDVGRLVLFRDIVDLGSFSRAASKWGLNHSTVSKHLKTLETELGVQLLRRTSRTMNLTDEGRLVVEHSRRIGACVEELMQRLEAQRGEVRGEIRVTSLFHVGRHFVRPAMASFLREYPQVRVTLVLDDGPLAFHRRRFDLAVRVGLPTEGSLTARKLARNDVCLVASPELIARVGQPKHPAELVDFPTVAYATDTLDLVAWTYEENGEYRSVEVRPMCRVNDGNALLDAVEDGLGVGYLSAFAVRKGLERGSLVKLLPDFKLPTYDPIYMLSPATEHASPRIEAFKRHLVATATAQS